MFLPAAFLASVIAGFVGTFAGQRFSEFIGFTTSGAFSAFGFVVGGLIVAPRQTKQVKWLLIILSALIGAVAAVGAWMGEDKLRVATGLTMLVISFALAGLPLSEVPQLNARATPPTDDPR